MSLKSIIAEIEKAMGAAVTAEMMPAVRAAALAERAARRAAPVALAVDERPGTADGCHTHTDMSIYVPAVDAGEQYRTDEQRAAALITATMTLYGNDPIVTRRIAVIAAGIAVPTVRFTTDELAAEILYSLAHSEKGRAALKDIAAGGRNGSAYARRVGINAANMAIRTARRAAANEERAAGTTGAGTYEQETEWANAQATAHLSGALKYRSREQFAVAFDGEGNATEWASEYELVERALLADGKAVKRDKDALRALAYNETWNKGGMMIMGTAYLGKDDDSESNLEKWWTDSPATKTLRPVIGIRTGEFPAGDNYPRRSEHSVRTGIASSDRVDEASSGSDNPGMKANGTIRLVREQTLATMLAPTLRWKYVTAEDSTNDLDASLTSPLSNESGSNIGAPRRRAFLSAFRSEVETLAAEWVGDGRESVRSAARHIGELSLDDTKGRITAYRLESERLSTAADTLDGELRAARSAAKVIKGNKKLAALSTKCRAARAAANRAAALHALSITLCFERIDGPLTLATLCIAAAYGKDSEYLRHIVDAKRKPISISVLDGDSVLAYLGLPIGANSKIFRALFHNVATAAADKAALAKGPAVGKRPAFVAGGKGLFPMAATYALDTVANNTDRTECRRAFAYARNDIKRPANLITLATVRGESVFTHSLGIPAAIYRRPAFGGPVGEMAAGTTMIHLGVVSNSPAAAPNGPAFGTGPYSAVRPSAAGSYVWVPETGRYEYRLDV